MSTLSVKRPDRFQPKETDPWYMRVAKSLYEPSALDLTDPVVPLSILPKVVKGAKPFIKGATTPEFLKKAPAKPAILAESIEEAVQQPAFIPHRIGARRTEALVGKDAEKAATVQAFHEMNAERTARSRRMGETTVRGMDEAALNLSTDPKAIGELYRRPRGSGFGPEELKALEYKWTREFMGWQKTLRNLDEAKPETVQAAMEQYGLTQLWWEKAQGAASEWGRTGRMMRVLHEDGGSLKKFWKTYAKSFGEDPGKMLEFASAQKAALAYLDPTDLEAMDKILRKIPPPNYDFWDKLHFWVQNGFLAGAPTGFRNLFGNTSFMLSKLAETGIAGPVDMLLGAVSGRRTKFAGELTGQTLGIMQGLADGVPTALRHLKAIAMLQPMDMRQTRMDPFNKKVMVTSSFPVKGKLGEFAGGPIKGLQLFDQFAKCVIGHMESNSLAFADAARRGLRGKAFKEHAAKVLAEPPGWMTNLVEEEKLYRTFQTELGNIGKKFMWIRNNVPTARYPMMFIKTPANIFKAAAERSPLGWGVIAHRARKGTYKNWRAKGAEGDWLAQRKLAEDISKATMGTFVAAYFANEYMQGGMTGPMPTNAAERSMWMESGIQPYSVVTKDGRYVPIGRILEEPYGLVIESTLNIVSRAAEEDRDLTPAEIGSLSLSFIENIMDRSFLRGISDFTDLLSDPERKGVQYLQNIPTWFIPYSGMLASIARYNDPYYRRATTTVEKVKTRIPGLSKSVPVSRSPLGFERKRPGTPIQRAFFPFQITKKTDDLVIKEMSRLYEEADFLLSFPGRALAAKSWGIPPGTQMDHEEYGRFLQDQGKLLRQSLGDLFRNPGYHALADQQKILQIKKHVESTRGALRQRSRSREILKQYGADRKE